MAHSLTTIGRHLECAIQTKLFVELELALIKRKQSRRIPHNAIIWQIDTIVVGLDTLRIPIVGGSIRNNDDT